ncbi:MAG: CCA tRNA nucleotidyltransferase [Planctomycetaceae bacterium]
MARRNDRALADRVAMRLHGAGHEALLAGGCVRDRLRGVEPADHDLATSARPEEVAALFPRTVPLGAAFGVMLVVEDGGEIEVATFREDIGIADGRHPASVRYADARADAARRDFTINGMFEDPRSGAILDFVGGRQDLDRGLVRSIGDPRARFREDRLRLLRAVRFATTLDFVIEPATAAAIREAAPAVTEVSAERVRDELNRILLSGRGGRGLGLLQEFGLLAGILPEIAALDGVAQGPTYHPEGDVFTHTRLLLDGYREGGLMVALGALLHDIGKPATARPEPDGNVAFPGHAALGVRMTDEVMRRLRYPARETEQVKALVEHHMDFPNVPKMREAKRRRFLLREDFPLHLELHRLDCLASHGLLDLHATCVEARARLLAEPPPTRPLLDGEALKALGFRPGPSFRTMLDDLMDAQLEEKVTNAEEAGAWVLARWQPPDGRRIAGEEPAS